VRSAGNDGDSGHPNLLIMCSKTAPTAKIHALTDLGAQVEIIPDNAGYLSLPTVLATLAERNILSLLLECGSQLNGAFLQQNLADKAVLIYAETELGDRAIPFAQGIASPYLFEESLHRVTRATYDPDVCVTGYLHNPWPAEVELPSKAIS
jgi:diaminohydroxyphosphoribosylaminopyrimidine deaminase/5-amino-6-(5-phosphoribosylamino)uracil reductase